MHYLNSIIIVASVAIVTGCGQSPSSASSKFYMDISEGHIEEAMTFIDLAAADSKGFSKAKLKAALIAKSDAYNKVDCGGLKSANIVNEDIRGDIANQKIELVCKSGKMMADTNKMIKTKEGWRIAVGS